MKRLLVLAFVSLISVDFAHGGLVHITFDPPSLPGGNKSIDEWIEEGVYFTGPEGMGHADSGGKESRPDNGSAYLTFAVFETLVFYFEDSTPFQLLSVDLGEYSTLSPYPTSVSFVGHTTDGTTVTTEFMTDGIIDGTGPLADFETFTFGSEFSNLSYVEVPVCCYTMDNLFLVPIPEPATVLLLGLGVTVLAKRRH